jgi:hypothetical protein
LYTRAEAERQGHLVDLTNPPYLDEAERAGYRIPVAMARAVFDRYVAPDGGGDTEDPLLRVWDILWMSRAAANSGAPAGAVVPFAVGIAGHGEVTLTLSIRALADGPYALIAMPPEFTYLLVTAGELHVVRGAEPGFDDLVSIVGGGIEGVPVPPPVCDPVIGYCNNNGFQLGLGTNCYVLGQRDPIPGPLVVIGMDGDDHRSLTEEEVAGFSLQWLPGRPLPTLCVEGMREAHEGDPGVNLTGSEVVKSEDPWPAEVDEMENPHWCKCGWHEVDRGLVWERCRECGFTGIPADSVADVDNLLLAFDDGMGDADWGPFHWHSTTRQAVSRMSDHELSWAVSCGDESWMGLIAPKLKNRLPSYGPEQKATLLERGSRRWREWLIRNLRE